MTETSESPWRPVAVLMVPFALATWGIGLLDGVIGVVVLAWVLLVVAAAGTGTVLQEVRAVPRPRTTGVVVAVVAGWLTVTWYAVGWAAGAEVGPVVGAVGSLLAAQVGGAVGWWIVEDFRVSRASAVALATLPPLLFWLAWSQGDRPEIEAMTDDLEATGVPPYLVEVEGYDLERVYPGTEGVYDGPGITYWLRPRDGETTYILSVVVAADGTDVCPLEPDCRGLYETVELDGAVAIFRSPDSPDDLAADLDDVVADVGDAELVTYPALARLHPVDDAD